MRQMLDKREYPSTRRGSTNVYTVKRWDDGTISCDCPGWRFKRDGMPRTCVHLNWYTSDYYFLKTADATAQALSGKVKYNIIERQPTGFLVQYVKSVPAAPPPSLQREKERMRRWEEEMDARAAERDRERREERESRMARYNRAQREASRGAQEFQSLMREEMLNPIDDEVLPPFDVLIEKSRDGKYRMIEDRRPKPEPKPTPAPASKPQQPTPARARRVFDEQV